MKPKQRTRFLQAGNVCGVRNVIVLCIAWVLSGHALAEGPDSWVELKTKEIKTKIGNGEDTTKIAKKLDEDEAKLGNPGNSFSTTQLGIKPPIADSTARFDIQMKREQLVIIEQTRRLVADKLAAAAHAPNAAIAQVLLKDAESMANSANNFRARLDGSAHQTFNDTPAHADVRLTPPVKSCDGIFACEQLLRVFKLGPQGGLAFDASQKEPGGIKFNQERATAMSLALQIDAVDYDPVRGKITLIGKKSGKSSDQRFDLDVFSDILRLAVEAHEPFFSLDPTVVKDWDEQVGREIQLLQQRFGSAEEVAARIKVANPVYIQHGVTQYYYASVAAVAPDLAVQASRGHDVSQQLIFSPRWLRYSKVGWMLFQADLTIKSIAAGFSMHINSIKPSPAWQFADFKPIWISSHGAGRANFELDESNVMQTGTQLDLTEIRPKLYVTQRIPNTSEDLPPSKFDLELAEHFRRHWNDYVAQLPEIANLAMIYRAYVASRYLVQEHPGLAARILMMPREPLTMEAPLIIMRPSVLRAAYRDGHLVSLREGASVFYDIGGGYGGGTEFKLDHNVKLQTGKTKQNDWVRSAQRTSSADAPWFENGDQSAAVLDFFTVSLPARWHGILAFALALSVIGMALAGVFLRQYPWQHLRKAVTCGHCNRIQVRLGWGALCADVVVAGCLLYLAMLPLAAAAFENPSALIYEAVPAVLLVVGLGVACILMGIAGQALVTALLRRGGLAAPLIDAFFRGCRIAVMGLGASTLFIFILNYYGQYKWLGWLPTEFTERFLVVIGGIIPIVTAIIIGVSSVLISVFLRWVAPYALGSRPLPLLTTGAHNHSKTSMESI